MYVYVVGRGGMAHELMAACTAQGVRCNEWVYDENWDWKDPESVIIHVGSEARLREALVWCDKTKAPLIHASSGQDSLLPGSPTFPIILAPNLALPFVVLLAKVLPSFRAFLDIGMKAEMAEEHQLEKTSESETAAAMMRILDMPQSALTKARRGLIPHAVHELTFTHPSGNLVFKFSTNVSGREIYANGGIELARRVVAKSAELEPGFYTSQDILDL